MAWICTSWMLIWNSGRSITEEIFQYLKYNKKGSEVKKEWLNAVCGFVKAILNLLIEIKHETPGLKMSVGNLLRIKYRHCSRKGREVQYLQRSFSPSGHLRSTLSLLIDPLIISSLSTDSLIPHDHYALHLLSESSVACSCAITH